MNKNRLVLLGQLTIVLLLATYFSFKNIENLDVGTDEGIHAFTAKTLAYKGRYALETSEGFLDFDRRIAVGPTLIVPTAIVYKLFGFGLTQTRAVVGLYFLLFMASFFFLVKKSFHGNVALLASFLVLASLWPFWKELSLYTPINRILIGESAALFFLCLGALIYITGLKREKFPLATFGVFLIGTAVLTKLQFILSIIPTFGTLLFFFRGHKIKTHKKILATLLLILFYFLPILIWFFIQLNFFGKEKFLEVISSYSAFERQFLYLSLTQLKQNLVDRWSELSPNATRIFFIVPGLIYGWFYVFIGRTKNNLFVIFSLIFSTVWLAWFPFSKGFIRYAIPGLFFAHIFLALYFYEEFKKVNLRERHSWLSPVFSLTLLGILLLYGFYINNRELRQTFERDSLDIARYIEKNLPGDAVIETTELDYSVDLFLKERRLKHATPGIRNLVRTYKETYNPAEAGVEYIITDPLDKTYEYTLRYQNWEEIAKFGSRVLFKLGE